MRERDFHKEFFWFLDKIKNNQPFALSRFGDGELIIMDNKPIDLRNAKNGEFRYDPNISDYYHVRSKLISSFVSRNNEYYVGIACPCCVGQEKYLYMKRKSKQDEEHLTWANIFVNSNYQKFLDYFIPEMSNHNIILVVNNKANVKKLPFNVEKVYYVGTDAWYLDYDVIEKIRNDYNNSKNKVFLFAAGPLANILVYELWFYMNKDNIYLDIGSTLDTHMGMKPTRGYLTGAPTLKKKCIW